MSILIIISFLYFVLIIVFIIGFDNIKSSSNLNNTTHFFSILIPFRNEAENIVALVKSLEQLNYPKKQFEVIFVNDDSIDNSVAVLTPFLEKNKHFKILQNKRKSNSPKKDALNTALNTAKNNWIITTDADCDVPKNWLRSFSIFIEQNAKIKMIVAPVAYKTNRSFLQNFQNIDFLSLIGSTIGAFGIGKPFLCNGANLCYKKEAFISVNGFKGNDNIASGDDIFLMEKILLKYPKSVRYLKSKEVIVITKPENTFKGLLSQRIRWASKTNATKNWFGKLVGILVILMNLIITCGLCFAMYVFFFSQSSQSINTWFSSQNVFWFLFLLKFNIDFLLIQKTYAFIGIKNGLKPYILSSFLYPFFVLLIVFLSFFKKYKWKDRNFK
ncbi:MAG: glycosyltransferase [Flavobacteriaceae bacterium]|nr:glycosyltransferase [Flavobacteriaceae bacterium]